ncbi:hypothetical protein JOB18_036607 [Solea senegalensis]|uniref:Uncharacterized protein n=1 Tax=Solea senegalensis TaxID=28829 RepID=A0AAV6QYD9_SOLSE|nr:hypothetical protein JOB18_036607 [Solea senegalensis]
MAVRSISGSLYESEGAGEQKYWYVTLQIAIDGTKKRRKGFTHLCVSVTFQTQTVYGREVCLTNKTTSAALHLPD